MRTRVLLAGLTLVGSLLMVGLPAGASPQPPPSPGVGPPPRNPVPPSKPARHVRPENRGPAPNAQDGNNHAWAMVSSDAPADDLAAGVGAWATVQKPSTGFYDVSLFQVGARMGDNYVEVGWQVNLNEWGDYAPRLFTNAAGAGQQPCREDIYDCFVSTSTLATHGMLLNPGEQHFFGIVHYGSAWWVEFDSQAFGYFPDSLWNGKFTEAEEVAWQGEAISRFSPVCADMGNGVMGDDPSQTAAQVSTIIVAYYHHEPLYGWEWPTNTRVWESHPDWYRVSDVDDTMSFRFGGPGAC